MEKLNFQQGSIQLTNENSNVKIAVNNTEHFLPYSKIATKSTITPENFRDELIQTIGTRDGSTLLTIESPSHFDSPSDITIREKDGSSSNVLQKMVALGQKYGLTLLPFTIYRSMHCSGRHQSPCLYSGTGFKVGSNGLKKPHELTKKPFPKDVIGRQTATGALLYASETQSSFQGGDSGIQEYSNVSNGTDFIQGYIKIAQGCAGSSKIYGTGGNYSSEALPCLTFADLTTGKTKFIIMLASTSKTWHDNNYKDTVFRCWIKPILVQKTLASGNSTILDSPSRIEATIINEDDRVSKMQGKIGFMLENQSDQKIGFEPIVKLFPSKSSSGSLNCPLATKSFLIEPNARISNMYDFTVDDKSGGNWSAINSGFIIDMKIFLTPPDKPNRYQLPTSSKEVGATDVVITHKDAPATVSDVSLSINNDAKLEMSGGTSDISQGYLGLNDIGYINKSPHNIQAKCVSVQLMEDGSSYVDTDTSQLAANDEFLKGLSFTMYAKATSPKQLYLYQRLGNLNCGKSPSQHITDECRVKYELRDTVTNTYITSITSGLLDVPYSYT